MQVKEKVVCENNGQLCLLPPPLHHGWSTQAAWTKMSVLTMASYACTSTGPGGRTLATKTEKVSVNKSQLWPAMASCNIDTFTITNIFWFRVIPSQM